MKSDTKKSKIRNYVNFLSSYFIGMIRNKQYPYTIKTQDGTIIPSHEFIHRMTAPQLTGRFYEQKVMTNKNQICFFNFFIAITSLLAISSISWSSCKNIIEIDRTAPRSSVHACINLHGTYIASSHGSIRA
jgi:hypothetical protein